MDKNKVKTTIETLYANLSFFDLNSDNIIKSIITIIIFLLIYAYIYVKINLKDIRANWELYRCNPLYMPFAGIIHGDDDGISSLDYIKENTQYCSTLFYKSLVDSATVPIKAIENTISFSFQKIKVALDSVKEGLRLLKDALGKIGAFINNIFNSVLTVVNNLLIMVKDIFNRIVGGIGLIFYFIITIFNTSGSIVEKMWNSIVLIVIIFTSLALIPIIINIAVMLGGFAIMPIFAPITVPAGNVLVALGASIGTIVWLGIFVQFILSRLILWIRPATIGIWDNNPLVWPDWYVPIMGLFAGAGGVYTSTLSPLLGTLIGVVSVGSLASLPTSASTCFHKDTLITLISGIKKPISEIKLNDYLSDGSRVTTIFKLLPENEKLFSLNNVKVTGSHYVKYNNKWIFVKNHPNSILLNEPFSEVWCLNTTSKVIIINETIFSDWDEISDEKLQTLQKLFPLIKMNNIHAYLETGFSATHKISLANNTEKNIIDIKLGDILSNDSKVVGLVKISTKDKVGIVANSADCLYHLITNKGCFFHKKYMYKHYNNMIEQFNH